MMLRSAQYCTQIVARRSMVTRPPRQSRPPNETWADREERQRLRLTDELAKYHQTVFNARKSVKPIEKVGGFNVSSHVAFNELTKPEQPPPKIKFPTKAKESDWWVSQSVVETAEVMYKSPHSCKPNPANPSEISKICNAMPYKSKTPAVTDVTGPTKVVNATQYKSPSPAKPIDKPGRKVTPVVAAPSVCDYQLDAALLSQARRETINASSVLSNFLRQREWLYKHLTVDPAVWQSAVYVGQTSFELSCGKRLVVLGAISAAGWSQLFVAPALSSNSMSCENVRRAVRDCVLPLVQDSTVVFDSHPILRSASMKVVLGATPTIHLPSGVSHWSPLEYAWLQLRQTLQNTSHVDEAGFRAKLQDAWRSPASAENRRLVEMYRFDVSRKLENWNKEYEYLQHLILQYQKSTDSDSAEKSVIQTHDRNGSPATVTVSAPTVSPPTYPNRPFSKRRENLDLKGEDALLGYYPFTETDYDTLHHYSQSFLHPKENEPETVSTGSDKKKPQTNPAVNFIMKM